MKVKLLGLAVSLVVGANLAFGAGLADKKKWKKANEDMKSQIDDARKACGNKLAVSFDQKSYTDAFAMSIGGSCGNAVEALTSVCGKDADSKAAASKITKLVCKQGKTAGFKVSGSTATNTMDPESGGMTSAQIEAELEKQL